FSAVMRLFSLPVKRIRLHFTEGPTYRQAVGINTAQDDTVAFTSALRADDVVELRIYENHAPLLECRIEEPNRRSNRALLLGFRRITDPEVLYCVTIHGPSEQQFSLFLGDGSVITLERKLGIPSADETVKGLGLVPHRGIWIRRCKGRDHCVSPSCVMGRPATRRDAMITALATANPNPSMGDEAQTFDRLV